MLTTTADVLSVLQKLLRKKNKLLESQGHELFVENKLNDNQHWKSKSLNGDDEYDASWHTVP